jgi:sugar transferase (PEP-CTERM/EpsH1 system associated)
MGSILFLCHRLPWPPDTGDKIRSYHVLQRLVRDHRVYLGTFVDKPADWRHVSKVKEVCAGVCIRPLPRWRARWRALTSLARCEALTVGIYRDAEMRHWVDGLIAGCKIDRALCCSSGVAPFVVRHAELPRVMDFVDVDSDKWRQYAQTHTGLARMIYRREARRLANFERAIAGKFDASVFVSEAEASFFRKRAPESADKVLGIPNGVDAEYWDPGCDHASPYTPGERAVVFVGAMDYRANVHAVEWFARTVWPRIGKERPDARFYIVGSKPTAAVRALASIKGIEVTGRVEDVRPYVAHAHAVVAPLRIARGIQNKVLEALAMEKVVLATPEAWEGIEDFEGRKGCIDASAGVMVREALRWLEVPEPVKVPEARAMVQSRHDWSRNLDTYANVLGSVRISAVSAGDAVGAAGLKTGT